MSMFHNGIPEERIRASVQRVANWIRQSTPEQKLHNTGSYAYQRQHLLHAVPFGFVEGSETEFDARGESGDEGHERVVFSQLLDWMEAEAGGCVVTAFGDRWARNFDDGELLIETALRQNYLFLVEGMFYNPRNKKHRNKLRRMILDAESDNIHRTERFLTARRATALGNALRVRIATGLVWADPDDPAYRGLAEKQGLMRHLRPDKLALHKVVTIDGDPERPGRIRKILALPDPHPDVYRACRLAVAWLLQTGDPSEVLHRIRTRPEYPRPGLFPVQTAYRFRYNQPPDWVEATAAVLWAWFKRDSLYGTYRHTARALADLGHPGLPEHRVERAFPGLMRPGAREFVRSAFANPSRKWKRGAYPGPRNHALARPRCGHPSRGGKPCRNRLTPVYAPDGTYKYQSVRCITAGHGGLYLPNVEKVVCQLVLQAFRPEDLTGALLRLRRTVDAGKAARQALAREIKDLQLDVGFADEQAAEANRKKELSQGERKAEIKRWQENGQKWAALLGQKKAELERLEGEGTRDSALTEAECEQLKALASDVPRLIELASACDQQLKEAYTQGCEPNENQAEQEGLLRLLLRLLAPDVYLSRIGTGITRVVVRYPSGVVATEVLTTRPPKSSQPQRVWIAYRLAAGISPDQVAAEMNAAEPGLRTPWTSIRVLAVAYMHDHHESTEARDGDHEAVSTLAVRIGVAADDVRAAVFRGVLGPARVLDDTLAVCPEEQELDRAFPTTVRRRLAERAGWPEEDTVAAKELAAELGHSTGWVVSRASKRSGVARDAKGYRYVRRSEVVGPTDSADPEPV